MPDASPTRRELALPAEIGTGVLSGLLTSLYSVSFAFIVFGGPLKASAGQAMWIALYSAVVFGVAAILRRPFTGMMWQTQSVVAVVLGLAAAQIATSHVATSPADLFATVVVLLCVTALLTGAMMYVVGVAGLGQIAKSVPYPVVGGFLAATGCLLVVRAIEIGAGDAAATWAGILGPETVNRWLPPLVVAIVMLLAERRVRASTALVAGTFCVFFTVYAGLAASGTTPAEARAAGILVDVPVAPGTWRWALTPELLGRADWTAVFHVYQLVVSAAVLATLGSLLNLSAIEFSTGEPNDLDAELRAAGVANLIAGLGGGLVGYQSATLTQLATNAHQRPSRLGAIASAAVVIGTLLAGPDLLNLLPTALFTMLLAYLGLGFLRRWLIVERARLPREDYLIVVLILGTTMVAGFVWAVAAGIVVASLRFTVAYARVPVLRSSVTGAIRLSSTERSEIATRHLIALGDGTLIFEAQGYMFFGTANSLFVRISRDIDRNLEDGVAVRHIVIDLHRVQGIDVSAVFMFDRLARQALRRGIDVTFAGLKPQQQDKIERGIGEGIVRFFPTLDDALTALEEAALREAAPQAGDDGLAAFKAGFRSLLDRIEASGAPVDVRRTEISAGTRIFERGEASDSLLVLETGRLFATVRDSQTPSARVATFLPGAVVGEIGFVTGAPRTASVVAETDCTVRIVTRAELDALKKFDAALALELTEKLGLLMAQRLTRTTALLHAVSR